MERPLKVGFIRCSRFSFPKGGAAVSGRTHWPGTVRETLLGALARRDCVNIVKLMIMSSIRNKRVIRICLPCNSLSKLQIVFCGFCAENNFANALILFIRAGLFIGGMEEDQFISWNSISSRSMESFRLRNSSPLPSTILQTSATWRLATIAGVKAGLPNSFSIPFPSTQLR